MIRGYLASIQSRLWQLRQSRPGHFITSGLDVLLSLLITLISVIPPLIVVFLGISFIKGGEPFHRLRDRSDAFFRARLVINDNTEEHRSLMGFCRDGIHNASAFLATHGDKIIEARREIAKTEKEREDAGEQSAEDIRKFIQIQKEVEEK